MALLKILLFAGARDVVGADYLTVDVESPIAVEKLKATIAVNHPKLASIIRFSRLAIDREFVEDQFVVGSENLPSEIALIPPVSGG